MRKTYQFPRLALLLLFLLGYSTALHDASYLGAVSQLLANEPAPSGLTLSSPVKAIAPDPAERIGIVVLFAKEPVAQYRLALNWRTSSSTAYQQERVRFYSNELRQAHDQFLRRAEKAGIDFVLNQQYTFLLNGLALSVGAEDYDRLLLLPEIEAVFPDQEVFLDLDASVASGSDLASANSADDESSLANGNGVKVAIVDTGIDYTHPDLGGCFGSGCKVAGGHDLRNGDADPLDDNGHGTHCAGIVAANGSVKGAAPGANLYAYKVLDAYGYGSMSTVIAGIERAADPDQDPGTFDAVDIISLSVGSAGNPDDAWSMAVDTAVDSGVTVVASVGNLGPEYGRIASPGVARKALAVGAADTNDMVADFSSRGPVPDFDQLMKPQITAPGVDINSTWLNGGYMMLSGTSMAAPHVAGAAALIRQVHPSWTPFMIESALLNNAADQALNIYMQGAGKVKIDGLFDAPVLVSPGLIGLGMMDPSLPSWSASQTLQVSNITAETRNYTLGIKDGLPAGLTASVQPDNVTLAAGETAPITFSVLMDTSLAWPNLDSNEGRILVQSGSFRTEIPFAFMVPDLFRQSFTLPYGTQTSYGVDLGDLDGDGDEDAFIANANYYEKPANTVWWNDGEGLFSDSGLRLGESFSWSVDLGDLDGDGDLDAFVANSGVDYPLADRVWFNDGTGVFTQSGQSIGNSSSRDVKLGDLDGDGDLDAFVVNSRFKSGSGEANKVWLNNGQGFFDDSGQSVGSSLSQSVALGDLDGDNDLDAFVANGTADRGYGRANKVWINNGQGSFTDSGQNLGDSISQDVALGDLDGDGDLDAFVANGGSAGDEGQPDRVWLNNGSAIFVASGQGLGNASSFGVALADLHGDGRLDAFVAGYHAGNKMWLNSGSTQMHPGSPGFGDESAVDVAVGDVDGDGDIDAIAANAIGRQNRVWLNRGSGAITTGTINVLTNRADAAWRIAGPKTFTGSASRKLTGVPSGAYRITWGSAPGCTSPLPASRTLAADHTILFEGEFRNCSPSAPKLITPPPGGRVDMTPALSWSDMGGTTVYRVQLAKSPDFAAPEVDQTSSDAVYIAAHSLSEGRTYWRVRAANDFGEGVWSEVRTLVVTTIASIPFHDGFESAELSANWGIVATADGRVLIGDSSAYAGSQSLLLDDGKADDVYSRSAADLMINLEGQSDVNIAFWWRNWRLPDLHGQDGVFFSDDYGRVWHKALSFEEVMPAYHGESIDVTSVVLEHDLTLNDHFMIRFQSLGDDPISSAGGYAIDELNVATGPKRPTNLALEPISQSRIDLNWQDNAADESAFHIERRSDSADYARVGTVPADTTVFKDSGLFCGTHYAYRLRAFRADDGAYSGYSNSASAFTGPCGYLTYLPAVASTNVER